MRAETLKKSADDYSLFRYNQTKEAEFFALFNRVKALAKKRNNVAHGMAAYYYGDQQVGLLSGYVINLPEHKESTYCLTSPLYDKRDVTFGQSDVFIDLEPEYIYFSNQIQPLGDEFRDLAVELIHYEMSLQPRRRMERLYETDTLAWAAQQAALLRQMARGERLDEPVDWPNVIEEVQDVGLSELRACQSLLEQALTHLLKLDASPDSQDAKHWRDEVRAFLNDAQRRFTPSMRQRLGLADLYDKALRRARPMMGVRDQLLSWPETCPFSLQELLSDDVAQLSARLASRP